MICINRVFCPGSGLGRLPFEICLAGYESVANEYSYFMLLMSNFILNQTNEVNEYVIYPSIHQVSNVSSIADLLKPIRIPDVNPNAIPENALFGCVAGDFLEVYNNYQTYWDAICTCFFIDTANNVIEFVETIYKSLKPNGIWINLGPLLYHYSEMVEELSLELSLDQIIHVAKQIGFIIEGEKMIPCVYTKFHRSMMHTEYNCAFFVGVKPSTDG